MAINNLLICTYVLQERDTYLSSLSLIKIIYFCVCVVSLFFMRGDIYVISIFYVFMMEYYDKEL